MEKKNTRLGEWVAEQMQDPEFVAAWQELEPGYQVARLRIGKGITQAQLAAGLGTTQTSISRLESGRTPPSLTFLRRVVEALGGELTITITNANGSTGPESGLIAPT